MLFSENLSVAQRKANKAKYTSNLSSQCDELRKRRYKKQEKRKHKSTKHLSDIESSDLSRSESDTNIYLVLSTSITRNGKYLFSLIFLDFVINHN